MYVADQGRIIVGINSGCACVGNQLWLSMYVWGSKVATKCMLGINGGRTCVQFYDGCKINYVLSTIA